MAWQNAGWNDTDYSPSGWFEYAVGPLQSADAAWNNKRWLANRWTHTAWTDTEVLGGAGFTEAGLGADVDVQGFIAGFQFSKQGTAGTVTPDTFYSGFSPDPDGILDNDSDPDGDPLSFNVLTQPEVGTLTTYVGGAFAWVITPGTAVGRYFWTYELFAGGESGGTGTVSMEHGDLFASASVQGYEGQLNYDFQEAGTAATVFPTGFSGGLTLTIDQQGTAATVVSQGNAGTVEAGWVARGTSADNDTQGFSGGLADTFDQQGTQASATVLGFAGTLDVGVFFNDQGTLGAVDVTGYAGALLENSFSEQGTAGTVTITGNLGNFILGVNAQGIAAQLTALGKAGYLQNDIAGGSDTAIMRVDAADIAIMKADRTDTAKMRVSNASN